MNPDNYALFAAFVSLMVNGVVNFPSSQAIYLGAGLLFSGDFLFLIQLAFAGAAGNSIGNILLQAMLVRASESKHMPSLLGEHAQKVSKYVTRVTLTHLYLAKVVPGIKVLVPYVAQAQNRGIYQMSILYFSTSLAWSLTLVFLGNKISSIPGAYKYVAFVVLLVLIGAIANKVRKY
jgi:hypothetical protein